MADDNGIDINATNSKTRHELSGDSVPGHNRELKFPRTRRNLRAESESGNGAQKVKVYQLDRSGGNPDPPIHNHFDNECCAQVGDLDHKKIDAQDKDAFDYTDAFPVIQRERHYRWYDLLINLFSIVSFLLDMGSDIYLCTRYYGAAEFWNFGLTLTFVAIPSLTMSCFSLRWYIIDYMDNQKYSQGIYKVSRIRWLIRYAGLILQVGPVIRYIDTMYYGIQTWRSEGLSRKYYYSQMLFEDADSCLLRLIECTMESGPQLVLQLRLMATRNPETDTFILLVQTVSCCLSLVSLVWSITSYARAMRYSRDDKQHMHIFSLPVHFLWQLFMVTPRVIALAMFSVVFSYWVFLVIGLHWLGMTAWLIKQSTIFTVNKCEEVPFDAVIGVIYVMCYLNVKEGRTRHKYVVYYAVSFIENAGMIVSWYLFRKDEAIWYDTPALLIVVLSPFVGLVFMSVYYLYCHPTGQIQVCLSDNASKEPSIIMLGEVVPTRNVGEIELDQSTVEAVTVPTL